MEKFFQWLIKGRGAYVLAVCLGLISISSLAYGLTLNNGKKNKASYCEATFSVNLSSAEMDSMSKPDSSFPLGSKSFVPAIAVTAPASIVKCVAVINEKTNGKTGRKARLRVVLGDSENDIRDAVKKGIQSIPYVRKKWGKMIDRESAIYGVDSALVTAVMAIESEGDSAAVSVDGALNVMQIWPKTGYRFLTRRGIQIRNGKELIALLMKPSISISLGVQHLREGMDIYHSPVKAVIAYEGDVVGKSKKYGAKDEDLVADPYYRKVYAVYAQIKEDQWDIPDPAMLPARPPETGENFATVE